MKRTRLILKIHPAGLLVFAGAFLLWDSHLVLACAAALVLHEGAHLLVMLLCGMKQCTIELTPFGGMADPRAFETFSPWKRGVAAAAGVLASACVAWSCILFAPHTPFWYGCFQANLSLALVNSLPAWPLDGARVLAAFASWLGCERQVRKILASITVLLGMALTTLGLVGVWRGIINPSLLVMGPYLCYAAKTENLSERIRRLDGAENKLNNRQLLPVSVFAVSKDLVEENTAKLLGQLPRDRYHLMIRIDPVTGQIQKCCTETELLRRILTMGGFDGGIR